MIETQHLPEAGGKNEQPDQRAHQRRDEAFALVDEAQRLTPDDALEADQILRQREAVPVDCFAGGGHLADSSSS